MIDDNSKEFIKRHIGPSENDQLNLPKDTIYLDTNQSMEELKIVVLSSLKLQ